MAVNEELLKKVLEEIRPNLQADGGDMEYVGVDDEGVVKLELQGACAGCPMELANPFHGYRAHPEGACARRYPC